MLFLSYYDFQISIDKQIKNNKNVVVIKPVFTSMAYSLNGFYKYYFHKCDTSCLTVKFTEKSVNQYNIAYNGIVMLSYLDYHVISDIDVDRNPGILNNYTTVIVMHNEYATQKEFDAITNHSKVIYLYPNSLYGKIETNYNNDTITLIRGHGYPNSNLTNGFNWKLDDTNFESTICTNSNWKFIKIENGYMLNCYPEKIIKTNHKLLEQIQKLS